MSRSMESPLFLKTGRMIAELWKEPFRVWFPGGKEDATISLISVHPQGAEYWDSQGVRIKCRIC